MPRGYGFTAVRNALLPLADFIEEANLCSPLMFEDFEWAMVELNHRPLG